MADVRRTRGNDDGSEDFEPLIGPNAEMDRRGFLSATTLAVLGIATGYQAFDPGVLLADDFDVASTAAPVWRPSAGLATVSVAANSSAKGYPALVPGTRFNEHPAVAALESALKGLSGGSAVAAIQSAVAPGGTVLIKPNWVEPAKWANGKITHPSLILAVARIAAEAVGPTGHVFIGEGTSEGRDLPRILSATTFMHALHEFGLDAATSVRARVQVIDLNASSAGSVLVKLRGLSRFASVHDKLYDASGRTVGRMGDGRVGAYRIARPILNADLVIDFAKAKVHCSAGVTLALKNFIGIVPTSKDPSGKLRLKYVPHYSAADARNGSKYVLNKTIGRTSADLHAAAIYVARDGSLQRARQRKLLCIIDGVVSGQNNQFNPQAKSTGWIAAGYDPVAVDHVASRCMGFDPALVQSIKPAAKGTLKVGTGSPADVRIVCSGPSAFTGYFTAGRALKPESLAAKWGKSIALRTWSLKAPAVSVSATHVSVKPAAGSGLVVRVLKGGQFANLPRAANGTYSADLPDGTDPVRVVVMDSHFNVWDRVVLA